MNYIVLLGQAFEVCDGHQDCLDRSDERGCRNCSQGAFRCATSTAAHDANSSCIPVHQRCDRARDCLVSLNIAPCEYEKAQSSTVCVGRLRRRRLRLRLRHRRVHVSLGNHPALALPRILSGRNRAVQRFRRVRGRKRRTRLPG